MRLPEIRLKRLELLYLWYGMTLAVLLLVIGQGVPNRWLWSIGYAAVIVPALLLSRSQSLSLRFAAAGVLVPIAFWTLGVLMPDLVPEPFEWEVVRWNRAIGGDVVQSWLAAPPAWLISVTQVCYSTFYFLPMVLGLCLVRAGKLDVLENLAELIVGGFLLSYLGYILMPTLPPYRFESYTGPLEGGVVFGWLHTTLDQYEALRQDCMPSGHTMMTLLTLHVAARHAPRQLIWLAPVSFFLILGTVVLRYHWFVDLMVAIPFTVLALWLFRGPATRLGVALDR